MSHPTFERPDGLPLPRPSVEAEPFWEALKDGKLTLQTCTSCGERSHPPRPMCRKCRSMSFEWQPASGRGTVYSYVVTHQPIHPSLVGHTPFLTVEIELEEGPRVISNLVDVGPDDVEIGMPVEVVFHRLNDDVTLPLFQRRR